MEYLKLNVLNLSSEESTHIIEFLAQKRGVSNYKRNSNNELLNTLKNDESKNKQLQIISKNKERIRTIRGELKELSYKLSKSELKEIKKRLYNVENKKGLLEQKEKKIS